MNDELEKCGSVRGTIQILSWEFPFNDLGKITDNLSDGIRSLVEIWARHVQNTKEEYQPLYPVISFYKKKLRISAAENRQCREFFWASVITETTVLRGPRPKEEGDNEAPTPNNSKVNILEPPIIF